MRKFIIITLFPEMFEPVLNSSMLWKAQESSIVSFDLINLREFGLGPRRQVDDTIYGGGDGMLLMIEPLVKALEEAKKRLPEAVTLLMSPSERVWSQQEAVSHADSGKDYIVICGRYEGVDARLEAFIDEKISVGQYILTGGELPAMVVIDSITRLLPGVLGGENSAAIESYSDGDNLEFPQYTRPEDFRGMKVPEVLLSGNHAAIDEWRAKNSK
ncbi:MAG: tRNA (guanosine(37)-N1)-methyltransferase TrmD [Candidatus Nomurabacteria bacterium]|jgi:tRNA (guanine37-N1)-methyltransferase|nr:tRNA (guanosine(37)-N1)-methyltransferase TrmD [Candidatus Nomurabacteria bacterium]